MIFWSFTPIFEPSPLIEGCELRFEGVGRIWEAMRMIGETRDKGDPSGALGKVSKRRHLPQFLFCNTQTHFL